MTNLYNSFLCIDPIEGRFLLRTLEQCEMPTKLTTDL